MKVAAHLKKDVRSRRPQNETAGVSPNARERIPELDGLRGIAILLVLIFHYFTLQIRIPPPTLLRWIAPGLNLTWSGVDLFFVLSGFLIGGILMDHRESPNYFRAFYLRRFWRIVPVYAAICLLFWSARYFFELQGIIPLPWLFKSALPWPFYATFTQNIGLALAGGWFGANWLGVTWSLAIEEQFYLLAPVTLKWLRLRLVPLLAAGAIALGLVLRLYCATLFRPIFPNPALTAYVMMPCHMDGLAIGIFVAWLVRKPSLVERIKTKRGLLLAFVILNFAMLWGVCASGWSVFSPGMILIGYTWLAFFYGAVLLYALLFSNGIGGAMLRFRPLRGLGLISYGVYLLHQPVSGLCHWMLAAQDEPVFRNAHQASITVFSLVLVLTLAFLSWRFFERPLLRRGHRHAY